jgi:hypothetical protein
MTILPSWLRLNQSLATTIIQLLTLSALVTAHMEMARPPPIKSKHNKFYNFRNIDYSYNDPLGIFPCKGYHMDEPPVATEHYMVGETQTLT